MRAGNDLGYLQVLSPDGRLSLPADLHDLYRLYQKEIHAAAYSAFSPYSTYGSLGLGQGLGSTFTADATGRGLYTAASDAVSREALRRAVVGVEWRTRENSNLMNSAVQVQVQAQAQVEARGGELPAIRRGRGGGERMFRRGGRAADSGSRSSGRSPNR